MGDVGNRGVISYDCRYMQARHLTAAAVAIALSVLSGCSGGAEVAANVPSSSAAPTTTSTAPSSASRPAALYPTWSAKFDAVTKPSGDAAPKCTEARPKSQTCMDYLTDIVMLALELRSEINARPDASRYTQTLGQIEKITDASESYAKCTTACYGDAATIAIGSHSLTLRLQTEDPVAQR